MPIHFILIFLSLSAFSAPNPVVKVIPNPESAEDFEHQFKGCPENSECDQVMGLQLGRWREFVGNLKETGVEGEKRAAAIESYRVKYGLPVEFYTTKKSIQGYKPLYFDSSCKEHKGKIPETSILRGMSFLKSLSKEKAFVWRDQTQIEVPLSEGLLIPQPVIVYENGTERTYYLPLGDQPLLIKNKELYVLKEEDGFFYVLKVSESGDWQVVNLDFTRLSFWESLRENVNCPAVKNKTAPKEFGADFCKSIIDDETKKPVVVRMHQGCAS